MLAQRLYKSDHVFSHPVDFFVAQIGHSQQLTVEVAHPADLAVDFVRSCGRSASMVFVGTYFGLSLANLFSDLSQRVDIERVNQSMI